LYCSACVAAITCHFEDLFGLRVSDSRTVNCSHILRRVRPKVRDHITMRTCKVLEAGGGWGWGGSIDHRYTAGGLCPPRHYKLLGKALRAISFMILCATVARSREKLFCCGTSRAVKRATCLAQTRRRSGPGGFHILPVVPIAGAPHVQITQVQGNLQATAGGRGVQHRLHRLPRAGQNTGAALCRCHLRNSRDHSLWYAGDLFRELHFRLPPMTLLMVIHGAIGNSSLLCS
jgi:hypothetical protein